MKDYKTKWFKPQFNWYFISSLNQQCNQPHSTSPLSLKYNYKQCNESFKPVVHDWCACIKDDLSQQMKTRNLEWCNKHLKIPISTTLLKLLKDWDITYAIWFVSQRKHLTISYRCTKSHNGCGQQQCCDIAVLVQSDCVRIFWTSSCAELGPYIIYQIFL